MTDDIDPGGFELSAAVVLWRGDEVLVMKRAGGFSAGGWFLPGGHLGAGERPAAAAARELREETGIEVDPASLCIVDVMTYDHDGSTAHCIIYNAQRESATECVVNEEHYVAKWMTPEAYIARFLDSDRLRSLGIPADGVALAAEVARVVRAAADGR